MISTLLQHRLKKLYTLPGYAELEVPARQPRQYSVRSLREWQAVAENLAKEGVLPPYTWLVAHNYGGLFQVMRKFPQHFKEFRVRTRHEERLQKYVKQAEKLAAKFGKLPNRNWLHQRRLSGLAKSLKTHPELFKHIPQKTWVRLRTVPEWVKVAESLARKNRGKVPSVSWLQEHRYSGLNRIMNLHKKRFKHLQQHVETNAHKPEYWVEFAKNNFPDKIIPAESELERRGIVGLRYARSRHPDLFKEFHHAPPKPRRLQATLCLVTKLVKKYGEIPSYTWLRDHGHEGLNKMLRKYPDQFAQFPRETQAVQRRRHFDALVALDRRLVKRYGKRQSGFWLRHHGYRKLAEAIYDHPKLFNPLELRP